jgi:alpha-1,6-mannosyltransferase
LTSSTIHFVNDANELGVPRPRPRLVEPARWSGERDEFRIVDVSEFYSDRGGGIRSHLTARGEALAADGHHHTVIASGPRDEERFHGAGFPRAAGTSRVLRFGGPSLPYDRTYYLLHRFDRIRRTVQAERPDVLEAHSPYLATAAIMACGRDGARLRTAFWHSDHVGTYVEPALARHLGPRLSTAATRPLRQGIRALLAPYDATFAASEEQVGRLRAAGVRRVIHAPFGIDTRVFRPGAFRPEARREWLRCGNEGALLLIGCGRFAREKRWDVVIDAVARIRTKRKVVLVLFGDGPERAALARRAGPHVFFAGFERDRRRLAAALASADALVHASPTETFGLGIAEAVASGLPIVVPDQGAAVEQAKAACAEVYRSLDVAACAAAIERLFERPLANRLATSLAAAANALTVEQHCRQVTAAYRDLLRELGR